MAKITSPLPISTIPISDRDKFQRKKYTRTDANTGDVTIIYQQVTANGALSNSKTRAYRSRTAATREALAAWKKLSFHKRTRWSECGISKLMSGLNLYISEWLKQDIQQPHQPISPCSARVRDSSASPWNYWP